MELKDEEENGHFASEDSEDDIVHTDDLKNYNTLFRVDEDNYIRCFSKRELKARHRSDYKNLKFVGEFVREDELVQGLHSKEEIGEFEAMEVELPLYKYRSFNRFGYVERGFVRCHDKSDSYVVFLSKVLWPRIWTIILSLSMVAGGLAYVTKMISDYNKFLQENKVSQKMDIDPNATDLSDHKSENEPKKITGGIQVKGYKELKIQANTKNVTIAEGLQNPAENSCYSVITIKLKNGDIELFKSKLIPPGKALYELTLNEMLAPGKYAAVLHYDHYKLQEEEYTALNSANVELTLVAE